MESDPIALIKKAKEGNTEAYGALYKMYLTPVYRYVYIRVRDKSLAEDIAQNVFLKVFQVVSRFEDTGKSPLAYFLTVAKNTLIDHFRKKKDVLGVSEEYNFESVPDTEKTPLQNAELGEASEHLYTALQHLSSDQRQAVSLKYLNSLSNLEIAEFMGKSEDNVRKLQSRGLQALRKHLEEFDHV